MSNFQANFSDEELIDILRQQITGPNADLLCEAVIGLIHDADWKKGVLLKAAMGSADKPEFILYQDYYVEKSNLNTYDVDFAAMETADMIDRQGYVKCRLIAFHPFRHSQYTMEYKVINTSGKTITKTYDVYKAYIEPVEEFPEDMI